MQRVRRARPGRRRPPRRGVDEDRRRLHRARAPAASIRWRVSGVSGACSETKSARSSSASAGRRRGRPRRPPCRSPRRAWPRPGRCGRRRRPRAWRRGGRGRASPAAPSVRQRAVADGRRGLDEAARGGEQERQREVGGGVGEDVGRVADGDAARRRRRRGRCCRSRRRSWRRAQVRRGVEQLPRRRWSVSMREQPLGVGDELRAAPRRRRPSPRPDVDVVPGGEAVERVAGQSAGDEDVGHEPDSRRSRPRRAG